MRLFRSIKTGAAESTDVFFCLLVTLVLTTCDDVDSVLFNFHNKCVITKSKSAFLRYTNVPYLRILQVDDMWLCK